MPRSIVQKCTGDKDGIGVRSFVNCEAKKSFGIGAKNEMRHSVDVGQWP
jgi:hypothetical protein